MNEYQVSHKLVMNTKSSEVHKNHFMLRCEHVKQDRSSAYFQYYIFCLKPLHLNGKLVDRDIGWLPLNNEDELAFHGEKPVIYRFITGPTQDDHMSDSVSEVSENEDCLASPTKIKDIEHDDALN